MYVFCGEIRILILNLSLLPLFIWRMALLKLSVVQHIIYFSKEYIVHSYQTHKVNEYTSRGNNSWYFCLPSQWRSTFTGKNLLLKEQNIFFKVDLFWKALFIQSSKQEDTEVVSPCKNGCKIWRPTHTL